MAKVNVLREIFEWSADRPHWQRDALRRLIVHGELKKADIDELTHLCKGSHGLIESANPEPLTKQHLPEAKSASSPVALSALQHNSGVNALASQQTIAFGPRLTVVYGANAAGKSGYTRILKRACRARGAEEILGNVLSGAAPGRPSATLRYKIDGADHDYPWDDGNPPHRELSRVSVFDRHCASVYVTEQTDVAYRPLGLDLFDKLSEACEAVRRILDAERRELEAASLHLPDVAEGTKVHKLLSNLTSLTKPDELRTLALLSDEEITKLDELRKRLQELHSEDPQKTARTLEIRAKRLESLALRIASILESLSDCAITHTFATREKLKDARLAAETMRGVAFENQPLPNTGSDTWRSLWAAAQKYSEDDAYPEEAFPVTETNARCVLCQQQLREEAVERFRRFHDFLSSEVQRERDQASAEFEERRAALSALAVVDENTNEIIDELHLEESDLAQSIKSFLQATQDLRVAVINALADESVGPTSIVQLDLSPPNLPDFIEKLRARAVELRGVDRADKIKIIDGQLRELEARQVLGKHINSILGEIERKQRIAAYQLCLEDTRTNPITRKSTEVTKNSVTEQLASSFDDELKALRFQHVEVEMVAAGGSRGALYHKLQLRRAPGVSVPKVVSEGEARCLSIASFFAELSTTDDRSAILFDDPVSSLDHHWRVNVAERLVDEAVSRQVIVFTHDIVFLLALVEYAEKRGVELTHQCLRRASNGAGFSEERLPWAAMNVNSRLGHLKQLCQNTAALYRRGEQVEYEHKATHIYGLLREAWERAVEEVLLNGVVERYRNSVETTRARYLNDICDDDCKALKEGMTKCSRLLPGHDQAPAEVGAFPEPTELDNDVKVLDDWVKAIRARRR